MKSLVKTTKETPKASTMALIISLLTGLLDMVVGASALLGLGEKTIGLIGFGVALVVFVVNTIQNNASS